MDLGSVPSLKNALLSSLSAAAKPPTPAAAVDLDEELAHTLTAAVDLDEELAQLEHELGNVESMASQAYKSKGGAPGSTEPHEPPPLRAAADPDQVGQGGGLGRAAPPASGDGQLATAAAAPDPEPDAPHVPADGGAPGTAPVPDDAPAPVPGDAAADGEPAAAGQDCPLPIAAAADDAQEREPQDLLREPAAAGQDCPLPVVAAADHAQQETDAAAPDGGQGPVAETELESALAALARPAPALLIRNIRIALEGVPADCPRRRQCDGFLDGLLGKRMPTMGELLAIQFTVNRGFLMRQVEDDDTEYSVDILQYEDEDEDWEE